MARQGIPYLYTPPDNDNDLASIYREKYLCRSTGIQHHMPRDRGAVSLTSTLGNKQRDLGPGCRICGEPAPVFRAGDPGAQPAEGRAFVGAQESREDISAHC